MPATDILEELNSYGLGISREIMGELCTRHISAESLVSWLKKDRQLKNCNEDFLYIGIKVLWEKWFPDILSLDLVDDQMQKGYQLQDEETVTSASFERINYETLEIWKQTWNNIKKLMDQYAISDIQSFDRIFGGSQFVYNWSMDYDIELENAMIENTEFALERIKFCTEYIERYNDNNEHNVKEMIRGVANSYFRLHDIEKGEELLSNHLKEDPEWGGGWTEWADLYHFNEEIGIKDSDRAISILKQGLEVPGLRDRDIVLNSLHSIYIDLEMYDESEKVSQEIGRVNRANKNQRSQPHNQPNHQPHNQPYVAEPKTGRNDPCPCGSGKKYKKCCESR